MSSGNTVLIQESIATTLAGNGEAAPLTNNGGAVPIANNGGETTIAINETATTITNNTVTPPKSPFKPTSPSIIGKNNKIVLSNLNQIDNQSKKSKNYNIFDKLDYQIQMRSSHNGAFLYLGIKGQNSSIWNVQTQQFNKLNITFGKNAAFSQNDDQLVIISGYSQTTELTIFNLDPLGIPKKVKSVNCPQCSDIELDFDGLGYIYTNGTTINRMDAITLENTLTVNELASCQPYLLAMSRSTKTVITSSGNPMKLCNWSWPDLKRISGPYQIQSNLGQNQLSELQIINDKLWVVPKFMQQNLIVYDLNNLSKSIQSITADSMGPMQVAFNEIQIFKVNGVVAASKTGSNSIKFFKPISNTIVTIQQSTPGGSTSPTPTSSSNSTTQYSTEPFQTIQLSLFGDYDRSVLGASSDKTGKSFIVSSKPFPTIQNLYFTSFKPICPNQAALIQGRYCPCPATMIWSPINLQCVKAPCQSPTNNQCPCTDSKLSQWNQYSMACQLDCTKISNAFPVASVGTPAQCICKKFYNWNAKTMACQTFCTKQIHSIGPSTDGQNCLCDHQSRLYNSTTRSCYLNCGVIQNSTKTPPNSNIGDKCLCLSKTVWSQVQKKCVIDAVALPPTPLPIDNNNQKSSSSSAQSSSGSLSLIPMIVGAVDSISKLVGYLVYRKCKAKAQQRANAAHHDYITHPIATDRQFQDKNTELSDNDKPISELDERPQVKKGTQQGTQPPKSNFDIE